MKRLEFSGYSDDTFGEYLAFSVDYDNCANGNPIDFLVKASDGAIIVSGHFRGCWTVGTRLVDYGAAPPPWPMRFEPSDENSHKLVIEAPDDVTVEHLPLPDRWNL